MVPSTDLRRLVGDLQEAAEKGNFAGAALQLRRLMHPWGVITPLYANDRFDPNDHRMMVELWKKLLVRRGTLIVYGDLDLVRMACACYGLMTTASIEQAFPRLRLSAADQLKRIKRVCREFARNHPSPAIAAVR